MHVTYNENLTPFFGGARVIKRATRWYTLGIEHAGNHAYREH
jgi:hypothetical protein